jgi:beta-N-acetylhexosaminidase
MIFSKMKGFFVFYILLLPSLVFSMTLEEKVGQLLVVHFEGEDVNSDAKALIEDVGVSGFIYYNFSNGDLSFPQVSALSRGLQSYAQEKGLPPLLIAADQEGGIVARCTEGFTVFPGNGALGKIGENSLAEEVAFVMGKELKAAGINMNLAPVVDINSNPQNPIIGLRSFGDSKEGVISLARSMMKGYQKAGVLTCLKHFPGHGDVSVDSHISLPVVTKSKKELEQMEFAPFAALSKDADSIMTAHIQMKGLGEECTATVSARVHEILRKDMGFSGVIVTDSLVMEGFLKTVPSIEEGALAALLAGSDLILLGGKQLNTGLGDLELKVVDVKRIHRFLVQAVKEGKITEKRIDESLARVLALKNKYQVEPKEGIVTEKALSALVATKALKVERKAPFVLDANSVVFAPKIVQKAVENLGLNIPTYFFSMDPSEEERNIMTEMADKAFSAIFCSYNAWRYPGQKQVIQTFQEKPLAFVVLRDPLDEEISLEENILITTYSPTAPSIRAAFSEIMKK